MPRCTAAIAAVTIVVCTLRLAPQPDRYKQLKRQLSEVEAEAAVLSRTFDIVEAQQSDIAQRLRALEA